MDQADKAHSHQQDGNGDESKQDVHDGLQFVLHYGLIIVQQRMRVDQCRLKLFAHVGKHAIVRVVILHRPVACEVGFLRRVEVRWGFALCADVALGSNMPAHVKANRELASAGVAPGYRLGGGNSQLRHSVLLVAMYEL